MLGGVAVYPLHLTYKLIMHLKDNNKKNIYVCKQVTEYKIDYQYIQF